MQFIYVKYFDFSNLYDKLERLWNKFIDSSSMSMVDCLSIDHVGMILKFLAQRDKIDRPLAPYLKTGQPNLIICPESDILPTVLSVYMENENLPLPSRNEVLLCNEDTTAEDVELLIRRAVCDETGRIFMLVSVHLLNYEVACDAEKMIEEYTQGRDMYRFVIICCDEEQDRSQLVAALDNYRVHTPHQPASSTIQVYLKKHLVGRDGACGVDPNR